MKVVGLLQELLGQTNDKTQVSTPMPAALEGAVPPRSATRKGSSLPHLVNPYRAWRYYACGFCGGCSRFDHGLPLKLGVRHSPNAFVTRR